MALFLPTCNALIHLACKVDRLPNDPGVERLFDALVLRGHLKQWGQGWWEIDGLNDQPVLEAAAQLGLIKE